MTSYTVGREMKRVRKEMKNDTFRKAYGSVALLCHGSIRQSTTFSKHSFHMSWLNKLRNLLHDHSLTFPTLNALMSIVTLCRLPL